jgi:hypothetical protein
MVTGKRRFEAILLDCISGERRLSRFGLMRCGRQTKGWRHLSSATRKKGTKWDICGEADDEPTLRYAGKRAADFQQKPTAEFLAKTPLKAGTEAHLSVWGTARFLDCLVFGAHEHRR